MNELIINDVELELDLLDADVMEKYQKLNEAILEEVNAPGAYEGLSAADSMRKQCRIIDHFFDELFGTGTANTIFGVNNNLGKRMEGFAQISKYAQSQNGRIQKIIDAYDQRRIKSRVQANNQPERKVTTFQPRPNADINANQGQLVASILEALLQSGMQGNSGETE